MIHIFDEKKSAQIRLKIAPIARTTSRVGQIWPQIIFLIFWKVQYPDSGCLQGHFSSHNLDLLVPHIRNQKAFAHAYSNRTKLGQGQLINWLIHLVKLKPSFWFRSDLGGWRQIWCCFCWAGWCANCLCCWCRPRHVLAHVPTSPLVGDWCPVPR